MPNCSRNDVILVRYPFSDLSSSKVRPAVVISAPHSSQDVIITPLTSKTSALLDGEFVLSEWATAGLNVATAVKRGVFTVREDLVLKVIGQLVHIDAEELNRSLQNWLGL